MKKSELTAILALSGLILGGCVTTTTGPADPETGEDAAEYNYELGVRYLQNENYDLARDRLQRALELDPRMGKAHMTLGMAYEALDNPRLATESYEASVRVEPRNYELHNGYAVFLCKQRDFDKARRHFTRAANHPENDTAEITLTNAGPAMAGIDPAGGGLSSMPPAAKALLCFGMLLGRVELLTLLTLVNPAYWKR